MSWNHRVMKEQDAFTIREVFYDDEGEPNGYTGPIAPLGDSLEELRSELERMLEATQKPTVEPT